MTSAIGECAGCGRRAPLADDTVFGGELGWVLRCVGCDAVLLRLVRAEGRAWLDLRGLTVVQLTLPD